jgi:subtilisin family serine protease
MEKSYYIVYQDDLDSAFRAKGLNKFIILNERLAVLYTPEDFKSQTLNDIYEVSWYSETIPMSSMIEISDNHALGDSARDVSGVNYLYNNVYNDITGDGVLIAIIDSGVDYLHPDLIRNDGSGGYHKSSARRVSIWK